MNLTAKECIAQAEQLEATLRETIINDPRMRRHLVREAKAWRKLAEERS